MFATTSAWRARFEKTVAIRRQGLVHTYSCIERASGASRVALLPAPHAERSRFSKVLDDIERLHGELDHPLIPRLAGRLRVDGSDVVLLDCQAATNLEAIINHWAERLPPQLPYAVAIGLSSTLLDVLEHAHGRRDPLTGRPICMGGMRWCDILVGSDGAWWFTFGRNLQQEVGVHYAPEVAAGGSPSPGADLYAMQMMLRTIIPFVQLPEEMLLAFRGEASESSNEWFRWIETRLLAGRPELRPKSVAELRPLNEAHWHRMGVRPDPAALRLHFEARVREIHAGARVATPPGTALPESPSPYAGELLRVNRDGRWFASLRGQSVDISRRGALRRIVAALTERRVQEPGKALSVEHLVAAGWPNQTLLPDSAANRLYVAMSTLRGLGFPVQRRDDGYLLPVGLAVRLEAVEVASE